jgi:hypothetical protein
VTKQYSFFLAVLIFALGLFAAAPAYAVCSSPAANEGAIEYFSTDDVYKICDGTNWQNWFIDDPLAPYVHLNFNETAGTTANDTGSQGTYDGTLINTPTWQTGAIQFTSTSFEQVTIPNLILAAPITHSIWIRRTATDASWHCVVCEDGDSGLWFIPGTNDFGVYPSAGGLEIMSAPSLTLNAWSHIVVTDDGTTSRMYHNGTQVDTSASRVDFSINSFAQAGGMYYFHGLLDDYRLYNRALTADEIAELYEGISTGLVGYWRLDETSGTSAADSSGNGNTGTMNGGLSGANAVGAQFLSGLDFDGTDDDINAGSAAMLDDLGALSACAWVYPDSLASDYYTVIDKSVNGGTGWNLYTIGATSVGGMGFGFLSRTNDYSERYVSMSTGTWHHICVTWDGVDDVTGSIKLYYNGSLQTPDNPGVAGSTPSDAANNLKIGEAGDGSYPYNGRLDEVRLYNRVLSAEEIASLYNLVVDPACSKDNAISYSSAGKYYTRCNSTTLSKTRQAAIGGACTKEGDLDYLSASDTYRFCNGSNWIETEARAVAMPTANLAHHWNLDESAGTTAANPTGSNAGSLLSTPVWQSSGGRIGGALEFDSALDRVNITQITTTTPITFSFWMRRTVDLTGGYAGIYMGILTEDNGSGVWHNPDQTSLAVYDTAGNERLNGGYIPTNVWKHVAVVDNGTTSRLYVDAVEVDTSASRVDFNIRSFGNDNVGGYPFTGLLDDIRIYTRALSAAEIEDIVLTAP